MSGGDNGGEGGGTSRNPWAWLGLLKWSLSYTDGTVDRPVSEMSTEDREFLEKVMQDGIIDENERMKSILKEVAEQMSKWREARWSSEEEDRTNDLLQELRDFVEQIDFARAFAAMKGLEFLLGCVQERDRIPKSTRSLCLGILATLSSNNPPVQKELLELGSLKSLSDLFFLEEESENDTDGIVRSRSIQAVSAITLSLDVAEAVFCQLEQSPTLIMSGLGMGKEYESTPQVLRQRTLFLLRALATSDALAVNFIHPFRSAISWVAQYVVDDSVEKVSELREMALAMLHQILEQRKVADVVLACENSLAGLGVRRIAALRALCGPERDMTSAELEHWEAILVLIARA